MKNEKEIREECLKNERGGPAYTPHKDMCKIYFDIDLSGKQVGKKEVKH